VKPCRTTLRLPAQIGFDCRQLDESAANDAKRPDDRCRGHASNQRGQIEDVRRCAGPARVATRRRHFCIAVQERHPPGSARSEHPRSLGRPEELPTRSAIVRYLITLKEISLLAKTSLDIDHEKVDQAKRILGTRTLAATVDAALDEVINLQARRRLMDRIRREGGIGPSPEELRRLREP